MSIIGLNQIARQIKDKTEETFEAIVEKLNDNSAFKNNNGKISDFDRDINILSTINEILNQSIGTKMYSKIDALMIVNNLCHESI